jgi:hypothetical protein
LQHADSKCKFWVTNLFFWLGRCFWQLFSHVFPPGSESSIRGGMDILADLQDCTIKVGICGRIVECVGATSGEKAIASSLLSALNEARVASLQIPSSVCRQACGRALSSFFKLGEYKSWHAMLSDVDKPPTEDGLALSSLGSDEEVGAVQSEAVMSSLISLLQSKDNLALVFQVSAFFNGADLGYLKQEPLRKNLEDFLRLICTSIGLTCDGSLAHVVSVCPRQIVGLVVCPHCGLNPNSGIIRRLLLEPRQIVKHRTEIYFRFAEPVSNSV